MPQGHVFGSKLPSRPIGDSGGGSVHVSVAALVGISRQGRLQRGEGAILAITRSAASTM